MWRSALVRWLCVSTLGPCFVALPAIQNRRVAVLLESGHIAVDHEREHSGRFKESGHIAVDGHERDHSGSFKRLIRSSRRAGQEPAAEGEGAATEGGEGNATVAAAEGETAPNGTAPNKTEKEAAGKENDEEKEKNEEREMVTEEKLEHEVAASIGLTLVASVTFLMILFYGIHFPDPDIQNATWKTLAEVSAAFCAVLLYCAIKNTIMFQTGIKKSKVDAAPDKEELILAFALVVILATIVQVALVMCRNSEVALHAWGLIGGIMVAFASIHFFGLMQQLDFFRQSAPFALLGCLVAAMVWGTMCCVTALVRRPFMVLNEDGTYSHECEHWDHSCKHAENESHGIMLGLLLSRVIRFFITGHLPAIDGSPKHKSPAEIDHFMIACFALFLPVLICGIATGKMHKFHMTKPHLYRLVEVLSEAITMTWAWSFVFLGRWVFWSSDYLHSIGLGNKMAARMTCAFLGSIVGLLCIYIKDFIADRCKSARQAFDSMIDAVILGIAIGWETAFKKAVKSVAHISEDKTQETYVNLVLSLFLCSIIVPACVMYMLPMALKEKKEWVEMEGHEEEEEKEDEGEVVEEVPPDPAASSSDVY